MWSDGGGGRGPRRDAGRRTGTAAVGEVLAAEAAHAGATVAVTTAVPSEEATTAAQSSVVAEATENKPAALATETKSATEKAAVAAATESGLPSSNKPGAATLHLEKTNESGGNRW